MSAFTDLKQYHALQLANDGYWFDLDGRLHGAKITWAPLPENGTQPRIKARSLILHTNAGSRAATWRQLWTWLNSNGQTGECTFDIDNTGYAGQFMSAYRRADCNFDANSWTHQGTLYGALSIETGDNGVATLEQTPWNLEQLDTLICIGTASAIQLDTGCGEVFQWDGAGIDYHTKFPYYGPGIKAWTNKRGKTCPGTPRKRQLPFIRQQVANRVGTYMNHCTRLGVPHGIKGL
jgi:hypothetical protein